MAPSLPPDVEDEEYASSQDSDFAPDDTRLDNDISDSEDDGNESARPSRRGHVATPRDADDYDNSGDEAIIKKGRKRRKLAQAKADAEDGEFEEGGLIKTRRQRAAEREQERNHATSKDRVTIDVDAIWAEMMAGGSAAATRPREASCDGEAAAGNAGASGGGGGGGGVEKDSAAKTASAKIAADDESAMIRIKRTYTFAGRVHTEEKLVPRDSAEAKLFLASREDDAAQDQSPAKARTRKAFRSVFEPVVVDGAERRSDLNLGLAARMKAAREAQAKKLNTVEKSRMDWAGYVDKEGIKDELELAGRSKDSYASRQQFLARSEALREGEARRARLVGRN